MKHQSAFGLYVHWPFCTSKCPYCDFNSHVAARIDVDRWRHAYRSEIARIAAETGPRVLSTIFFGGGTPSLMPPDLVADIVTAARAAWHPANAMEITLEANPGSVEAGRFRTFRDAGVNRVSLGLQALNDADLRRLGRMHSVDEALRAVETAQSTFDRVSVDLIYARQGQDAAAWAAELRTALALGTEHLSLYQLTVEPGTVFAERHARGQLPGLPEDDDAAALFDLTQDMCDAAGRPAYEISNHAAPGAECRHNLIYWEGGDYAGIGPGAHGRLTLDGARLATEAVRAPVAWLDAVERTGTGDLRRDRLSGHDLLTETLLMGLRLPGGIALDRFDDVLRQQAGVIADLQAQGLIALDRSVLRITPAGRLLTDRITAALVPDDA